MKPSRTDEASMRAALRLLSDPNEDVPVAALLLDERGEVIAGAINDRLGSNDPTAHAEVSVLRAAGEVRGNWRLGGCTLVVTLEPCPMCAGAAVTARIDRLVFGAWNADYGACGSVFDIPRDRRITHRPEVVGGVLAEECQQVLTAFFGDRRTQ